MEYHEKNMSVEKRSERVKECGGEERESEGVWRRGARE